jgi:hypothetical protein
VTASDPPTAAELQAEIDQTRERLGQTVEELAAKADVKARARAKAADLTGQVRRNQVVRRGWPLGVIVASAILIGSAAVWRRRKA